MCPQCLLFFLHLKANGHFKPSTTLQGQRLCPLPTAAVTSTGCAEFCTHRPTTASHTHGGCVSSCLSEIYINVYISNISDYVRPPSAAFPEQGSASTSAAFPEQDSASTSAASCTGVPSQGSGAGDAGGTVLLSSASLPLPAPGQRWGAHSKHQELQTCPLVCHSLSLFFHMRSRQLVFALIGNVTAGSSGKKRLAGKEQILLKQKCLW